MSINLTKGNGISLKKEAPSLKKLHVGLGWTIPNGNPAVDIDVCAFGLDLSSGRPLLKREDYFVYFNNLATKDGAIKHTGDNRTGAGAGDDESILVDLSNIASDVGEIAFIVTIYNDGPVYTFKDVTDAYIRLVDDNDGREIARYSLNENFGSNLAVQFGSLTRKADDASSWDFTAIGAGYNVGLGDILAQYGQNV